MPIDLYWLIADVDGKPLFANGRDPAPLRRRKVQSHQLKRMEYA